MKKIILIMMMCSLIAIVVLNYPNVIAATKESSVIYLDYKIDQRSHKIVFSQNNITITTGQTICIKNKDLYIKDGFLDILDFDWKRNGESATCFFKGIKQGTGKINFFYEKNNITTGELDIKVIGKNQPKLINGLVKTYYTIEQNESNDKSIVFFPQQVRLKIGQRMIILPKDKKMNLNQLVLSDYSVYDVLDEMLQFNIKGGKIFKAAAVGKVEVNLFIAHQAFLQGTIDVEVTK